MLKPIGTHLDAVLAKVKAGNLAQISPAELIAAENETRELAEKLEAAERLLRQVQANL